MTLHSTTQELGDLVTQRIFFKDGSVRTIEGVKTSLIEQGRYTVLTTDKAIRNIQTKNVIYVVVEPQEPRKASCGSGVKTLIFHFVGDNKLTRPDISPRYEKEGEMIKYRCVNGDMLLVNNDNINCIEIIKQDLSIDKFIGLMKL